MKLHCDDCGSPIQLHGNGALADGFEYGGCCNLHCNKRFKFRKVVGGLVIPEDIEVEE